MISNVRLIDIVEHIDYRGGLIAIESLKDILFDIKRVYCIYGVNPENKRGEHAHKKLKQLMVAIAGKCTVKCQTVEEIKEFELCSPNKGLLVEGLVWREMYNFSRDCVLMVIASEYYDEHDYIRKHDDFVKAIKNRTLSAD